jgi:hypothetical protein
MTTITATSGHFDMGRVISRTFGAIGKNFPTFVALTLLLYAVPQFLLQWGVGIVQLNGHEGGANAALPSTVLGGLLAFIGFILGFVLVYVLQACLVQGTVASLRGQSASLDKSLGTGFSLFLPLLGVSILMALGEVLGFIGLIVPGLMLMIRWSVAVPTLVVERGRGITGSMGRSADLTKGHRWSIFGLFVIVGIVFWLFSAVAGVIGFSISGAFNLAAGGPAGVAAAMHSPVVIGVQVLFGSLITLIGAVGAASLYYELRSLKEGVGASDLAAVFD